jgi:hypothetical protein
MVTIAHKSLLKVGNVYTAPVVVLTTVGVCGVGFVNATNVYDCDPVVIENIYGVNCVSPVTLIVVGTDTDPATLDEETVVLLIKFVTVYVAPEIKGTVNDIDVVVTVLIIGMHVVAGGTVFRDTSEYLVSTVSTNVAPGVRFAVCVCIVLSAQYGLTDIVLSHE